MGNVGWEQQARSCALETDTMGWMHRPQLLLELVEVPGARWVYD